VIRYGILTASDSAAEGGRRDVSGEVLCSAVRASGGEVVRYVVVPDDRDAIARELREMADDVGADVIFTTGGTGLGPRDRTADATTDVIDREVPGIAEAMRREGMKFTPNAMLSRQTAGTRGGCLIVNMPGSPRAVEECLAVVMPVIPHAVEVLRGRARDCARLRSHDHESRAEDGRKREE
jgi:molybdenum cofactor synthesis domain-containing protein